MDYKEQEFQDFLNEHKALSQSELKGLNFPREDFKKPRSPGVYIGTLVAKEWGQNMNLITYFEIGEVVIDLVCFATYRNSRGAYIPHGGGIKIEEANIGLKYIICLKENSDNIFLYNIEVLSQEKLLSIIIERLF